MKPNFPKSEEIEYFIVNRKLSTKEIEKIGIICITNKIDLSFPTKEYPLIGYEQPNDEYPNGKIGAFIEDFKVTNATLIIDFNIFLSYLQGKGTGIKVPFKSTVQLNNTYSAIITKDNIKVGCQSFTHDTIIKLYKESQKALKS